MTSRTGRFPATRAQEGLWAWREMHPGRSGTTVVHAFQLDGILDPGRLRDALALVADAHEALRTVFAVDNGALVQIVGHPEVSLSASTAADVRERIDALAARRFDVLSGCWQAELVTTPHATVMIFAADSLIFDNQSAGLLEKALMEAYAGGARSRPPGPHPVDLAVRQRRELTDNDRSREFWAAAMDGYTDEMLLPAPLTRIPPAGESAAVPMAAAGCSAALTDALGRLAREEETSLFVTVLGALKAFLHRRGLGPDNVVAIAAEPDEPRAIGYATNLVPVRDRVDDRMPFRGYLKSLAGVATGAMAHSSWPFQEIVRTVSPATPPARIVLAAESQHAPPVSAGGLVLRRLPGRPASGTHDATVLMDTSGGQLSLRWAGGPARMLEGTLERLAAGFKAFLSEIAESPDCPIERLPVMGKAERDGVLGGGVPYPPPAGTVLDRFDHQVATRPDALAVVTVREQVSYAALDCRARRIANAVGHGAADQAHPVVVALHKSADMVAALVAALRLGSFYLPLAPEYVPSRLADLLDRSSAGTVISSSDVLAGADLPDHVRVLAVDGAGFPETEARPADVPEARVRPEATGPDSVACLITTSGTTGVPKLVGVPNRAVVRLVDGNQTIPLGPADRTVLVANSSFDVATWEVWGALANGGAIVVPSPGDMADPARLCALIDRQRVTAAFFTVTLFARVLETAPERLTGLRHLLVGGEAVPPHLFVEAARHVPGHVLMNGYGPAENATYSCCYRLDRDPAPLRSVPIGPPLHGSSAYVLDEWLRPLPVGAVGEIVVAGAGLAVGYLNDPGLTAQRFPAHPWVPGERVYRTGDYGRLLPDGNMEYLGRRDRQVKIRGFRVELGDVEHALGAHPDIRNAVAFPVDAPSGRKLAAAAEVLPGSALDEAALRAWAHARLPAFMVPARAVITSSLPLTANGKVDLSELTAVVTRHPADGTAGYSAPASATEVRIAEAWASALGVSELGADDDLYAAGADSISALSVSAQLSRGLGQPVPPHLVFECRSVRMLADRLESPPDPAERQALQRRVAAARVSRRTMQRNGRREGQDPAR